MTPVASDEERSEVEPAPEADVAGGDSTQTAAASTRRPRLLVAAVVLVVVCAVFLAASAVVWWRADHDADRHLAQTRDVVLVDARRDVEVLNTLDYRKVADGLKQWRAVSTGKLGKQLGGIDTATSKALADAGKVTTAKVVDIAVTDLDPDRGTASAIAAVEISVRDQSGSTEVKRDRFTVGLTRGDGRWLASALEQLPVDAS